MRKREIFHTYTMFRPYFVYQKQEKCIIITACKYFRSCVSEREKLCHIYSMFMFQTMFIKKRETVSYIQYIYVLDFVYQKGETASYLQYVYVLDFGYQNEGNCVIHTVCLCSRLSVSERGKLYHTYNMFMVQIMCIEKWENV